MRTLDRNKQKMLYSLQTGRNTPIYEKDEQGNTKYITVDTGPSPSEMFETTSVDKGISDFAEKIREAIQNADWKSLGTLLGEKVNQITDSVDWSELGKKAGFGINGFVQTIYYTLKTIDFVGLGNDLANFINSSLEQIDFNTYGRLLLIMRMVLETSLVAYGKRQKILLVLLPIMLNIRENYYR